MTKSMPPNYVCHITIQALREAPFNLLQGDLVYARLRAKNGCGWSQTSNALAANVRVIGPPQSPPAPFFK